MPDAHKDFAYSLVATAPSPATSGTSLVVTAGDGAKFPTPPFNATVWATNAQPSTTNAEIVRVTAISTDTLTIVRAQEGTSARTVVVGDQIAATITARTLTDVENYFRPSSVSTAVDDFREYNTGELAWSMGNGSRSNQAPVQGHPGVTTLTSSAVSGQSCCIVLRPAGAGVGVTEYMSGSSTSPFDVTWIIRCPTPSVAPHYRVGFSWQSAPGANLGNNEFGFEKLATDTNWFVNVNGNATRQNTGVAWAGNAWVNLRLYWDGTTLYYSVNGAALAAYGGSGMPLPTSAVTPFFQIVPQSAAAQPMDIDLFRIDVFNLSR